MDVKEKIGELKANVDRLVSDVKSHGDKIDAQGEKIEAMRRRLAWISGITAVMIALGTVFGPTLGRVILERLFGL